MKLPWIEGLPGVEEVAAHAKAWPAPDLTCELGLVPALWLRRPRGGRPWPPGPDLRPLRVVEGLRAVAVRTRSEWRLLAETEWAASSFWLPCTPEGIPVCLIRPSVEARGHMPGLLDPMDYARFVLGATAARFEHEVTAEEVRQIAVRQHALAEAFETLAAAIQVQEDEAEVVTYQRWRAQYSTCPPHEGGCPGPTTGAPLVGCLACEWLNGAPL